MVWLYKTEQYVCCPQGGRHSAHIWCFLQCESLGWVSASDQRRHNECNFECVLADGVSSCCLLVSLLHKHKMQTAKKQKKQTKTKPHMHSSSPLHTHSPTLHLSTTHCDREDLKLKSTPVITCKDLVIIPSASSYLGHFLNNSTSKPQSYRQTGKAVPLIMYS